MEIVSISVVLYNNTEYQISQLFKSIGHIKSRCVKVYIIDNSPVSILNRLPYSDFEIDYYFSPENLGYGAGHNYGIFKALNDKFKYHIVINPDVYFEEDVVAPMLAWMKKYDDVGLIMPQVLNPDGSIQFLPKLLPSPIDLLLRKLKLNLRNYELQYIEQNVIYNAPVLSGCFTLINLEIVNHIGFYDKKFFLYFEDWDFSRRVHLQLKTIYFPKVSVFHAYQSNANKKLKHFIYFLRSAILYFNKWGWFFDGQRSIFNFAAKKQFEKK
jgi:GT2 family glycosyltransferase